MLCTIVEVEPKFSKIGHLRNEVWESVGEKASYTAASDWAFA